MATLESLAEGWESFQRAALADPQIGTVQRWEMRRAFYAGAYFVFTTVERIADPDVTEGEGVDRLSGFKVELEQFYRDLKAGRA